MPHSHCLPTKTVKKSSGLKTSLIEANEYLNNAKFLLNKDGKRKELFNEIGTRVATLKQLVIEGTLNFLQQAKKIWMCMLRMSLMALRKL
jgi:hypothetical protein